MIDIDTLLILGTLILNGGVYMKLGALSEKVNHCENYKRTPKVVTNE